MEATCRYDSHSISNQDRRKRYQQHCSRSFHTDMCSAAVVIDILLVQVNMQDVQFGLGEWPCGSWDITVTSQTLQLADTRRTLPPGVPIMYVIQIGDSEAFDTTLPRLQTAMWQSRSGKTLSRQKSSNWAKVCLLETCHIDPHSSGLVTM